MPTVVVLAPNRSGSSCVTSMLWAMGVDIGMDLLGPTVSQPLAHWEDTDFVRMNNEILFSAGGGWDHPPEIDWSQFRPELVMLVWHKRYPELREGGVKRGDNEWWGWKDPRTCLTAACYHQYLDSPHYIVVDRYMDGIVSSLEWREGKGDWEALTRHYKAERGRFLEGVDAPQIRMQYEDIRARPQESAERLAEFLGLDPGDAASMVQQPRAKHSLGRVVQLGTGDMKFAGTQVTQEGAWNDIHGAVNVLDVKDDAPDVDKWLAKVRPGGIARGYNLHENMAPTTWHWTYHNGYNGRQKYERLPFLKAGDPFGTIGIGVPYFKPEYDFWRWWSWILLKGLEPGDEFLNDDTVMAPMPIPLTHNRLMARFLETDRDTFCMVEDDHVAGHDIIRQMRNKEENFGYDIVCANYVNRREAPALTGYGLGNKTPNGEINCVLNYDGISKTGTQEVGGAAFGLVLIRRWVLDAILDGGKPDDCFWCEWYGHNSQDITFYWKAREVGARVGVDRDANIGHIGSVVKTVDDFWEWREGSK